MTDNLFSIANPESYNCLIRKYGSNRSVLYIEAVSKFKPPDVFYLVFYPVEYISCPIVWEGIGFHVAARDETLDVLRRIERYRDLQAENLLIEPYNLKLYTLRGATSTIQIVAKKAILHRDDWILS